MTAAADWIARRKALADAATDGPWTWTEGTNYDCSKLRSGHADAAFIADARTSLPRAVAALDAVLRLHVPMRIYDECDHPHQDGDPDVIDTGELLTCEEMYVYSICRECCVENPNWPEQAEWCADKHDHRRDGHCATVRVITEHLDAP